MQQEAIELKHVELAASYLLLVTCFGMEYLAPEAEATELEDGGHHWTWNGLNPWDLNMQIAGGHQLCSVHCIVMSEDPEYRKAQKSPIEAYSYVISHMRKGFLSRWLRSVGGKLRREAKRRAIELQGWHPPRSFFSQSRLLQVLSSDAALRAVPKWK